MTDLLYTEEGRIALVTLNRPAGLNSFTRSMRLDFIAAMHQAAQSDAVRAVVVTGAGRGFSAGADLKDGTPTREEVRSILDEEHNPGILAITQVPKPVIAAVHGFAAGIGLSYALACDLLVMGERTLMQVPFSNIGLIPDGGLCWQLVQRLGQRLAFEVAVEAEHLSATRCAELGLANRIVPEDKVLDEAKAWAARLADKAPLALAGTKRAMRIAASSAIEEVMRVETHEQGECVASGDFSEGLRAFREKRTPRFNGK